MMQLFNSLSRKKEEFKPINPPNVGLYTCGPTVYNYAHIGNLRAYVFADILKRTLAYSGYKINHIMNITDVGHLTSDADSGEDKMTKGLLREGKTLTLKNMRELAEFYTEKFKEDMHILNIEMPDGIYFASDYIKEDIELIKKLEEKGYAYKISNGIYFNTSKMLDYGVLWGGKRKWSEEGTRIIENSEKKNLEDFVLWKFDNNIGFESPFGQGFPGWHIECSAMSMKFLGEQFDVHTGGIDHISIHHTNEIAQSECATNKKPFVKFWLHNEFVDMGDKKMAKSEKNFLKLSDIKEKGINPLAYRLWLLMASYHTKMNFSWEALDGAENALKKLYREYEDLGDEVGQTNKTYTEKFKEYLDDDLDTPKALALVWELLKDKSLSGTDKKATLLDFDKVLGLRLNKIKPLKISEEVIALEKERKIAREQKDFAKSDELRKKINALGFEVKDTSEGQKISRL